MMDEKRQTHTSRRTEGFYTDLDVDKWKLRLQDITHLLKMEVSDLFTELEQLETRIINVQSFKHIDSRGTCLQLNAYVTTDNTPFTGMSFLN